MRNLGFVIGDCGLGKLKAKRLAGGACCAHGGNVTLHPTVTLHPNV